MFEISKYMSKQMNPEIYTTYYTKFRIGKLRFVEGMSSIIWAIIGMILGEEIAHYPMQPSDTRWLSIINIQSAALAAKRSF